MFTGTAVRAAWIAGSSPAMTSGVLLRGGHAAVVM